MKPAELLQQKQALSVFVELESEISLLHNQVNALGWKQRNELVEHVYSNYNNHDDLNDARSIWETEHTKLNVLTWIHKLFSENRDLFGYFENYDMLLNKIDEIIEYAVSKEEYEIAATLQTWRKKFP